MSDPGRGPLRALRGGILTALCTLVALTGHVAADGSPPPLVPLLVVALLLGGGFVVLAGRPRGFAQLTAHALGSQVAFHLAFSLTAGHTGRGGHVADHAGLAAAVLPDVRMLLGHLAAALVTAALLAHGDRVLWALHHAFRAVLLPWWRAPQVATPLRMPRVQHRPRPLASMILVRSCPRRGPPYAAAA